MGQELRLDGQAGEFPLSDRFAETGGIPVNDDGGERVENGHAVLLTFAGPVADFALASNPEGVLEDVMSLALVRAGISPALSVRGPTIARSTAALLLGVQFCPLPELVISGLWWTGVRRLTTMVAMRFEGFISALTVRT